MLGEGLDKGAPALQGLQLERLCIAAPHRAGEQHNDGRQVMSHILACSNQTVVNLCDNSGLAGLTTSVEWYFSPYILKTSH
jgi:hypothetical protein